MLHRIVSATPTSDYRVHLCYADGTEVAADFSEVIEQGGIMGALADPSFFAQVAIGERGRYLLWPDNLDFYADALRLAAQPAAPPAPTAAPG